MTTFEWPPSNYMRVRFMLFRMDLFEGPYDEFGGRFVAYVFGDPTSIGNENKTLYGNPFVADTF